MRAQPCSESTFQHTNDEFAEAKLAKRVWDDEVIRWNEHFVAEHRPIQG